MTSYMVLINKIPNKFKAATIFLITVFFLFYLTHFADKIPNTTEIKIGENTIYSKIANTEHKRSMGLSYTEKIPDNAGMLFVFDEVSAKNFWMRDMLFDIDIIWLDENKQVVGFFENVKKESYSQKNPELSKIYHSPENTKYVLEVNAGIIEKLKIKTGDVLEFSY